MSYIQYPSPSGVAGPDSSTNLSIATFDGTGGHLLKSNENALVTIEGGVLSNNFGGLSSDGFSIGADQDYGTISVGGGNSTVAFNGPVQFLDQSVAFFYPLQAAVVGAAQYNGNTVQLVTSASNFTISDGRSFVVLNPAAPTATQSITFPATVSNGQIIVLACGTNGVAALTLLGNGGRTITGAITSITSATPAAYMYIQSITTYVRIG